MSQQSLLFFEQANLIYILYKLFLLVFADKKREKRSVAEEITPFNATIELLIILDFACVSYFSGDPLEYIPYYGHIVSMVHNNYYEYK